MRLMLPSDCRGWETEVEHPGLLLDRWANSPVDPKDGPAREYAWSSKHQLHHLKAVIEKHNAPRVVPLGAWTDLADALGARKARGSTVWRLALHLSRATSVENAAMCLHPVHGFPYLPGSGLKGLTRAWATFHCPQNPGDVERILGSEQPSGDGAASALKPGSVIFLDAWPATKPTLELDIVNCHHRDYYGSSVPEIPGDWDEPNMTYFLTVAPGTPFRFGVAPTDRAAPDDAATAMKWLAQALMDLGAGTKTAVGYGYLEDVVIKPPEKKDAPAPDQGPPEGLAPEVWKSIQEAAADGERATGNADVEGSLRCLLKGAGALEPEKDALRQAVLAWLDANHVEVAGSVRTWLAKKAQH